MSKKLEKEIAAAQKFLAGLRTLPQFPEIAGTEPSLDAIPSISISESSSILDTLDESLWKPEWLEDFRAKVCMSASHCCRT